MRLWSRRIGKVDRGDRGRRGVRRRGSVVRMGDRVGRWKWGLTQRSMREERCRWRWWCCGISDVLVR